MEENLTIQQAAEQTGLSEHTLRYYERIGLIAPVGRAGSGHRRYSMNDLGWIDFLQHLRATGMPIAQMQEYAALQRQGEATVGARLALLEAHRQRVLAQIADLEQNLGVIEYKITYYSAEKARLEASQPEPA